MRFALPNVTTAIPSATVVVRTSVFIRSPPDLTFAHSITPVCVPRPIHVDEAGGCRQVCIVSHVLLDAEPLRHPRAFFGAPDASHPSEDRASPSNAHRQ